MPESKNFQPNWVSAPGDTISDILEERRLSPDEFARQMGCTAEYVNGLLHGREKVTIDIARQLETVIGAHVEFWVNRESQYRDDIDRLGPKNKPSSSEWLSELPVKDMIKFGWLGVNSASKSVDETLCLRFFGVPNVGVWRQAYREVLESVAFRTSPSFNSQPGAIAAWLRKGEIESTSIDCKRWDPVQFQETLLSIRLLTRNKNPSLFIPELVKRCAECGVAVVIVRAPTGCRASGATRFLSKYKALLLLSFRYLSDDHFWFTFFHEAGHILLHSKNRLFLEGANMTSTKEEREANEFAACTLIPTEYRTEMLGLGVDSRKVIKFARRIGVSPGIVVGQLQFSGQLKQNQFARLKRRYRWKDD